MDTTRLAGQATGSPEATQERAELVQRVLPRVRRYFQRLVPLQEADDLLQETLLRLESSLVQGDYDPARSYNAWLWLKARSVWVDWCRRNGRRAAGLPEGEQPVSEDLDPSERLDAETLLRTLRARLGEEVFETFVLYHEADLSQDQVAETVGCDPKTVRKRLRQADMLLARSR